MPDKPKPKKRKVCHGIQEDDQELCAPSKSSSVIKSSCSSAQIRAAFYPKFENEKSDHEIRARMIELVSNGLATLEVTLKHSGSLFMYAGHEGGAYAKNSFGNIYTAVGVFVLGRMFQESWGTKASKKQEKFNYFLKKNHMCISMELVTAVLGDHGQRPIDDYVIVTAISELGDGKPKFYSTSDIIAFCRKWRLPTNHVWLFSTRKSVTAFFAAFDTLREEGIATHVCQALNEIADISAPGSKDHVKVQGEILEGLVARIVSHESLQSMEQVLKDYPPKPIKQGLDLGLSLREICATHRHEEKQTNALLESAGRSFCPDYSGWLGHGVTDKVSKSDSEVLISRFLQSRAADFSTLELQETISLMRERCYRVHFKCYNNIPAICPTSSDETSFRLVIHILSDEVFQQYQKEMRFCMLNHATGLNCVFDFWLTVDTMFLFMLLSCLFLLIAKYFAWKKGLWPLYRGSCPCAKTCIIRSGYFKLYFHWVFCAVTIIYICWCGINQFCSFFNVAGFYVDINIVEQSREEGAGISKICTDEVKNANGGCKATVKDGLTVDDANLVLKLKFLTYMVCNYLEHVYMFDDSKDEKYQNGSWLLLAISLLLLYKLIFLVDDWIVADPTWLACAVIERTIHLDGVCNLFKSSSYPFSSVRI